jgi:hypothetical protein
MGLKPFAVFVSGITTILTFPGFRKLLIYISDLCRWRARRCYPQALFRSVGRRSKVVDDNVVGGYAPTTPGQARGDRSGQFKRDASSSRQAVPGSRAFCLRLLPGRRGAKREARSSELRFRTSLRPHV